MLETLDAAAVRRWCGGGLEALRAHQREIDELNVYPVPDGDTGTNLVLTLASAHEALETFEAIESLDWPAPAREDSTPLGRAMRRMARGALLGARGNSGVIVSQILRGMADSLAGSVAVRGGELARALRSASEAAYAAVARPVEGTVLSVAAAAAEGAGRIRSDDLLAVAREAARSASEALARTPQQLPVLARAGVVDAGGRGLCLLLDALVDALTPRTDGRSAPDAAAGASLAPLDGPRAASSSAVRAPDGTAPADRSPSGDGPASRSAPGEGSAFLPGSASADRSASDEAPAFPSGLVSADRSASADRPASGDRPASADRLASGDRPASADRLASGDRPASAGRLAFSSGSASADHLASGDRLTQADLPAAHALGLAGTDKPDMSIEAGGTVGVSGAVGDSSGVTRSGAAGAGVAGAAGGEVLGAAGGEAMRAAGAQVLGADGGEVLGPAGASVVNAGGAAAVGVGGSEGGSGYEVQYLLDAPAPAVERLRSELEALGDSLVVVGSGDAGVATWNVHVHVPAAGIGPALEAGIEAGRPHRISVTPLEQAEHAPDVHRLLAGGHRDWMHDGGRDERGVAAGDPGSRGAVVVAAGDGLTAIFAAEGATVVGRNPSTREMLEAIRATGADAVVLLPNDANTHAVASSAAREAEAMGVRVSVVPTRSPVQALAALAVRDAGRPFSDDVIGMAEAAGACRYGEVCTAQRDSLTVAGPCRAGDLLGLVDGEVHLIGSDLAEVSKRLVDRMLGGGGELATVVLGADAPADLENTLTRHVTQAWPFVELQCYAGGQPRYHLLVGVE